VLKNHSKIEKDEYGTINYSPEEQSGEIHHLSDLKNAVAYEQKDGTYEVVDAESKKEISKNFFPNSENGKENSL
jgi:hypothetical protein